MSKDRIKIAIPALDYLLSDPRIIDPAPNDAHSYDKLIIPQEYVNLLAVEGALHYPKDDYDRVARALVKLMQSRGASDWSDSVLLPNDVQVKIMKVCNSSEEAEQTRAIYLPFMLCRQLQKCGDYSIDKAHIVVFTFLREVQLLAACYNVACDCFTPPGDAMSFPLITLGS